MHLLKEISEILNMMEKTSHCNDEDRWMDRIQGILWVRNLIYKSVTQPEHDVEEYYKE